MNLKLIDQINKKCQALKREDVILVAVSKERSIEEIREAYDSGLRHFAENRLPEFVAKKRGITQRHPLAYDWKNPIKKSQ